MMTYFLYNDKDKYKRVKSSIDILIAEEYETNIVKIKYVSDKLI